jgi:hypothetical protein
LPRRHGCAGARRPTGGRARLRPRRRPERPDARHQTYTHTYSVPGASQIALHFERITTEANYDFLRIKNAAGTVLWTVHGNVITGGTGSAFGRTDGWCIIPGNSITIELVTDYSVTSFGYRTDTASAFY